MQGGGQMRGGGQMQGGGQMPPPSADPRQLLVQLQQQGGMAGGAMAAGGNMGGTPQAEEDGLVELRGQMASSCVPLTGESSFFEGCFYSGFWARDVPQLIPMPGSTELQAGGATGGAASFKIPEACRYGPKCRFKLSCSRFHGEGDIFAVNCQCDVENCTLGHPHRAARRASMGGGVNPGLSPMGGGGNLPGGLINGKPAPPPLGRIPPAYYKCNKCGVQAE